VQTKHALDTGHRHIAKCAVKTYASVMDEDVRIVPTASGGLKETKRSIGLRKIEDFDHRLHLLSPH
jgi:hypothetical protein